MRWSLFKMILYYSRMTMPHCNLHFTESICLRKGVVNNMTSTKINIYGNFSFTSKCSFPMFPFIFLPSYMFAFKTQIRKHWLSIMTEEIQSNTGIQTWIQIIKFFNFLFPMLNPFGETHFSKQLFFLKNTKSKELERKFFKKGILVSDYLSFICLRQPS